MNIDKSKKYSFKDIKEIMYNFNLNYTDSTLEAVAVISKDSFNKEYSEIERSYIFSNKNRAFEAGKHANSIFANCLDGTDNGIRLDWYLNSGGNNWKVDYCYFV